MRFFLRFAVVCLTCFAAWPALASDLKLEARLIWGVNDSQAAQHKPVAPDLASKLQRVFKWSNYYDITNQIHSIPVNESRDFRMSERCVLKIKNLGDSRIEVNCIGKGKEVSRGTHTLAPSQWVILSGNDKNNTAWFIGLREVDAGLADSK